MLALTGCAEVSALRQRNDQLEQTVDQLRAENAEFQSAYYKIKETMDSAVTKGQLDAQKIQKERDEAINIKSTREKELSDQLRTAQLEYGALKTEATEQKALSDMQIAELTRTNQSIEAERVAALNKVTELTTTLTTEQQRGQELDTQVGQLKVDVKTLQDQLAALTATYNERDQQAKTSEEALAKASADLAERTATLEARQKELETAQAEAASQKESAAQLEQKLTALQASVPSTDTLNAARGESETVKAQLAEAQQKLAASQAELEQVKASSAAEIEQAKAAAQSKASADSEERLDKDPALIDATTALLAVYSKAEGSEGVQVKLEKDGLHAILPSDSLFEPETMNLSERGISLMRSVVDVLGGLSGRQVLIEGHTDSDQVASLPFADNWGLGLARADKVRAWMMDQGVAGNRLTAASRAHFEPLDSNDTAEGKMANRRVEIIIGGKK